MLNRPILKSETVTIKVVNPSSRKIFFPDIPNLRGQKIVGVMSNLQSEIATSPDGLNVMSDALIKSTYLTIVENNTEESVSNLPVASVIPSLNAGIRTELEAYAINFEKCYINIAGTTPLTSLECIVFVFFYESFNQNEIRAEQARKYKPASRC